MIIYNKKVGGETDFLSYGSDTFNISEEKEGKFISRFQNSKKDLMLVASDGEKIVANASVKHSKTANITMLILWFCIFKRVFFY